MIGKSIALSFGLALLLMLPKLLFAKVNVFACEPEWMALAEEIGGDELRTFSATHALQDPHYIRARPSLIARIRRADLVFCTGAGLEIGWLPILLQKAKSSVQIGQVGYLMAAEYVPLLEKPKKLDRSLGDIHPEGNPHIHLDPNNILRVAKELQRRLGRIDVKNQNFYQRRYGNFAKRWKKAMLLWKQKAKRLRGKTFITHHRAWVYLFHWLGLRLAGNLEARPGIAPSPRHLEKLLVQIRKKSVSAIIRSPFASSKASKWFSAKSNTPVLILPYTIGGNEKTKDLYQFFEQVIAILKDFSRAS